MAQATAPTITPRAWALGAVVLLLACGLALCVGAVPLTPRQVFAALTGDGPSAATTIITDLRLPRICLAMLVGAMLSTAGCAYQGTFRNPLADPYLLGVSAGASLGATSAIVIGAHGVHWVIPMAAFVGAMMAVGLTYSLGRHAGGGRSTTTLVLAGVAVAALLTSLQTLVQQRNADKIREVYGWMLGRLTTSGWSDVALVAPYVVVCIALLIAHRRVLDVFAVGDEEASTMGLPVARARGAIIIAASLGTAAAVSVTGLIGFVGIIVPHALRLIVGNSYRRLVPMSGLYGAAYLVIADTVARSALAPAEIPIGVVTALIGAPFFLVVLSGKQSAAIA